MRSSRCQFSPSLRIAALILCTTFSLTQAAPAWAMRPETPGKGTPTNMGLEEALLGPTPRAGNTPRVPDGLWMRGGRLMVPFQQTWVSQDPIEEAAATGTFRITGVFRPEGVTAELFPNAVEFEWANVRDILRLLEAHPNQLTELQQGIVKQIQARQEQSWLELKKSVLRGDLMALGAMFAQGCRFCGHRGTGFSKNPLRDAFPGGHRDITVTLLRGVLTEVQGHELRQVFTGQHVAYQVAENQVTIAADNQSGTMVAQQQRGGVSTGSSQTITLDAQDIAAWRRYQEHDVAIKQAEERYVEDRRPGNRRRLEQAREDKARARRAALTEILGRHLGAVAGQPVNHLLNDYLGGSEILGRYYALCWGLKRFDQLERLFRNPSERQALRTFADELDAVVQAEENEFKVRKAYLTSSDDLKIRRRRLAYLQDMVRIIRADILANIDRALDLGNLQNATQDELGLIPPVVFQELWSFFLTLNAIDRKLETRGRDSLGMLFEFAFENKDQYLEFLRSLTAEERKRFADRQTEVHDLVNYAVTVRPGYTPQGAEDPTKPVVVTLVYKTARLVGKLGDNAQEIIGYVKADPIYQKVIHRADSIKVIHTRWASAGIISPENCHPVGNRGLYTVQMDKGTKTVEMVMEFKTGQAAPRYGRNGHVFAVLNGDLFNHASWILNGDRYYPNLKAAYERRVRREVSKKIGTDTQMIPYGVEHYLSLGQVMEQAVANASREFHGSFSVNVVSDLEPNKQFLVIGGGGQGLYIGISPDALIPSSEVYGFIEETQRFVKVEPLKEKDAKGKDTGRTIPVMVVLDRTLPPTVESIQVYRTDTMERLPLTADDVETTEVTSRDIDIGRNAYFFLKEVFESPDMLETTCEGRLSVAAGADGVERAQVSLDADEMPVSILEELANRDPAKGRVIDKVRMIAMGTANAAGLLGARKLKKYLQAENARRRAYNAALKGGETPLPLLTENVQAVLATEEGKFELEENMHGTLVIAISQSGGTKETNDVLKAARDRGARILVIVNRRDSDAVFAAREKGGGVLYTGTGRDVEIAVASTKAYYAQIAASYMYAMKIAEAMGVDPRWMADDARELLATPDKQRFVLERYRTGGDRHPIRVAARFWPLRKTERAFISDGPGLDAAEEVNIKFAELTYTVPGKDAVPQIKHKNLSAEPLLIIPAANIRGKDGRWWADYLMNQIDNFKAHKAPIILIATESEVKKHKLDQLVMKYTLPNGEAQERPIDVIVVPEAPEDFAAFTSVLAGHLLSYETALAITELSDMVTEAAGRVRAAREDLLKSMDETALLELPQFQQAARNAFRPFGDALDAGIVLQNIDAGTYKRFLSVLGIMQGHIPLSRISSVLGRGASVSTVFSEFDRLTELVRLELKRTIDAIRHQAKFVTVGVEIEGREVSDEFERAVEALIPDVEGGARLEVEHVNALLMAYRELLTTGQPGVSVFREEADSSGNTFVVAVAERNHPGILGIIGDQIGNAKGNIEGPMVSPEPLPDQTDLLLFRVKRDAVEPLDAAIARVSQGRFPTLEAALKTALAEAPGRPTGPVVPTAAGAGLEESAYDPAQVQRAQAAMAAVAEVYRAFMDGTRASAPWGLPAPAEIDAIIAKVQRQEFASAEVAVRELVGRSTQLLTATSNANGRAIQDILQALRDAAAALAPLAHPAAGGLEETATSPAVAATATAAGTARTIEPVSGTVTLPQTVGVIYGRPEGLAFGLSVALQQGGRAVPSVFVVQNEQEETILRAHGVADADILRAWQVEGAFDTATARFEAAVQEAHRRLTGRSIQVIQEITQLPVGRSLAEEFLSVAQDLVQSFKIAGVDAQAIAERAQRTAHDLFA